MPRVTVVQKPDAPEVGVELLAQSIQDIADGMAAIRKTRLSDRALLLLLSHSSGVGQKDVQKVLGAMDTLASRYLKPVKKS